MKKRKNIVVLFIFFMVAMKAQLSPIMWQVKTDTLIEWKHYFGDEFTSKTINETNWYNGYPWGGLFYVEDEYAAIENVILNDGVAELYAKRTNELRKFPEWMIDTIAMQKLGKKLIDGKYQLRFTGAAIWSKQQFKYGYFECKCKMPAGKGLWPAFWLYGGNPNDEIDLMELKGEIENKIHLDVHCPTNCDGGYSGFLGIKKNWGGWVKVSASLNKDWNIISGIWLPGSVTMFVNGAPMAYFEGDFKNPMNLIANLAVADDNGPFNPGPDKNTVFPAKMEVDYIRVWKPDNDSTLLLKKIRYTELDNITKLENKKNDKPILKKPIGFMFHKKKMKLENGFVSLYPQSDRIYKVTLNGIKLTNVILCVEDKSGKTVVESKFTNLNGTLNLSELKPGTYKITITIEKIKAKTFINI
jgi:beta-glucanase (GH16 family)